MKEEELKKLRESLDFSNANIDKSKPHISISEVLGMLQEPFDSKGVAEKTYNKHFNDVDSQYYQMSVEQIMEAWSAKGAESCKYGAMLDDYIGMNLNNEQDELELWKLDNNYDYDERLKNNCDSFDNFYSLLKESGDTVFVTREKTLYYQIPDTDTYIKGRFDALFYNTRTKKWIVIDWKSSGSVDKTPNHWTKNLYGPMGKYPALNWYTYTTQTYFYKKALVANYLPEGTTEDDVITYVVQLPGKIIEETGKNYAMHNPAYLYDSKLLDQTFSFVYRKKQILEKKK